MKVAIVGLGAIGGYIGARLAASGHEVSALARGETLTRVRERGLIVEADGTRSTASINVSDDANTLGPQDLVIVALKAPGLAAVAPKMAPLLGDDTMVLTAMNGVPWWFLPAAMPNEPPLESVDPGGRLLGLLPLDRVLGGVVHFSAIVTEPGAVRLNSGQHIILGEARGGESERARRVADTLSGAGFEAELSANVRRAVWFKLWGNMTLNPLSVLTRAATGQLLEDPLVRAFVARTMTEGAAIGARVGCAIDQSPEDRMAVTRHLGSFKTSMLIDAEAGRPIELDAIVTAVREIGARVGVETPYIDALLGITRLNARVLGLY
ncbi:MAG TPA: 2-dehydropantoate 2-reductase [Gemmatimonadaceae bacterium]|jgi:2-dehydropantoate 2-reductase